VAKESYKSFEDLECWKAPDGKSRSYLLLVISLKRLLFVIGYQLLARKGEGQPLLIIRFKHG